MTADTVTKTHTVHYLTVNEVDADLDRISGYTETGKHLETWACTDGECWGMEVESTMDTGYWAANYSELTDFVPGTDGGVRFWEDENNRHNGLLAGPRSVDRGKFARSLCMV